MEQGWVLKENHSLLRIPHLPFRITGVLKILRARRRTPNLINPPNMFLVPPAHFMRYLLLLHRRCVEFSIGQYARLHPGSIGLRHGVAFVTIVRVGYVPLSDAVDNVVDVFLLFLG